MSRPTVPGNRKKPRLALLRSVGCPEHLLPQADASLRRLVTPVQVRVRADDGTSGSKWGVLFHMSPHAAWLAVQWALQDDGPNTEPVSIVPDRTGAR